MKIVKEEKLNKTVGDQWVWNFDVDQDGIYIISISARCKNWRQNLRRLFGDDDLAVQIDDYLFSEIKGKKREFVGAGSWNGNEIKNDTKTVLYILPIKKGSHKIAFWAGGVPFVEEISVYNIEDGNVDLISSEITTFTKFLDIVIKNLEIKDVGVVAKADTSSKLEIIIDEKIQENSKHKKFKKWYWYGQELEGLSKDFVLPDGFDNTKHSVRFIGEGEPEIESIKLIINTENVVYEYGYIRLYKDMGGIKFTYLYSKPDEKKEILTEIKDGERVGIHQKKIIGTQIDPFSNVWHEVIYKGIKGFVLSSFVEIDGQEREKVIDLIKEKCNQHNIDANLMLAIAGKESHFKPYAVSGRGPIGIFQLSADARTDAGGVSDPYDMYQNVEAGVKYYKIIEKRFTGRSDILTKRLAAWYDGPTGTAADIRAGTFSYDKLSDETKSFIKSVKANMVKRDWYHIASILIVVFLLALAPLRDYLFDTSTSNQSANIVEVFGEIDDETKPVYDAEYFSDILNVTYTKNVSAVLNLDYPPPKSSSSPRVFLEEYTDQVVFLNSSRNMMKTIDLARLDLDKNLDITADFLVGYPHHNSIAYVVFEYPQNVFYFGATNSASCGASNCWFVLYRFNANTDKLEVIDKDVFGEIVGMYISPDGERLALVSGETGGVCANHDFISIYDTYNFNEQKIDGSYLNESDSRLVTRFSWINNNEITFDAKYGTCSSSHITKISWVYKVQENQIKEIKREVEDSFGV